MKIQLKLTVILAGVLGFAVAVHAQQRYGSSTSTGGGTSSSSGASRGSGASSSSQSYNPNGGVGSAVISIDPDTRSVTVIADDDTMAQISQVISNLDKPRPQVLIKVVFLELKHNNSSDIGGEGGWGGKIAKGNTSAQAPSPTVLACPVSLPPSAQTRRR